MKELMNNVKKIKSFQDPGVQFIWLRHLLNFTFILFLMTIGLLGAPFSAVADDLPNGGHVSGAINFEGDADTYTITVNTGETIQIRMADTSPSGDLVPLLNLYSPSGTHLAGYASSHDIVAHIHYTAQETGTYTLQASDRYGTHTGSYNIYFAHMPGANEHGELINDGVHPGVVDLGDLDTYTFSVNAGETVQIRMADTSASGDLVPILNLYSPSGTHLAGYASSHDVVAGIHYTAQESGTYTLLASDRYFFNTGGYNIYFARMPGANEHGELINDGVHPGVVDLGDLDTYTFSVNAGETVQIRMADTSASGDLVPILNLYSPSGSHLAGYASSHGIVAHIHYTAQESGTYTLLASDRYFVNTGSYSIRFARMPGANEHGELINGGVHPGVVDLGDLDTYTFSVNAGDTVQIRMTDTSASGDLVPILNLYSPTGTHLAGYASSHDIVAQIHYTAPESGTYTLLASDRYIINTGSYNIYFARMPGANEHGLLYNGNTLSEIIDLGDLDTYAFIADVGETFDIDVTDMSTIGDLQLRVELYGPSGGNYLKINVGDDVATISHTVTELGTYTVLVKDARSVAAATGEYEINCVTDGDNDIDGEDLYEFAVDYDNMAAPDADKDGSGTIDEDDVARFAREYGKQ